MAPSRLMPARPRASAASVAAIALVAAAAVSGCGSSSPSSSTTTKSTPASTAVGSAGGFTTQAFASGVPITISTPSGTTSVSQPDDITNVGHNVFVGFQNNVGTQGEPVPKGTAGTGNLDSTVVEFSSSGSPVAHWNVAGHIDGLTADPTTGKVVATTNEDGNAQLFVIEPSSSQAVKYTVPALPQHGGLDAIAFWHGMMLISASAPGNTGGKSPPSAYPAVYVASLSSSGNTVSVRSLFGDEDSATRANSGQSGTTKLALTDPDSNFAVPAYATRFGGQFELTSQGDNLQIFVADAAGHQLSVLKTSQTIDDSAWASGPSGALYVADGSADLIYKVTGPFTKGAEIVGVTPCNANSAPTACPAPGYPANYLGEIDQSSGTVSKLKVGTDMSPAGLLFIP